MTDLERTLETIVRRIVREELAGQAPRATSTHITVQAYAAARSISPSTVRQAIRDGRLPAIRVGRAVRVPAEVEIAPQAAKPERRAERAARALGLVTGPTRLTGRG